MHLAWICMVHLASFLLLLKGMLINQITPAKMNKPPKVKEAKVPTKDRETSKLQRDEAENNMSSNPKAIDVNATKV